MALIRERRSDYIDLNLNVEERDGRAIVQVAGEVDMFTAPRLREKLVEAVENGHAHIVVDLLGVEFMDSSGLGVLLGALKRVRGRDGSLILVCTSQSILKILEITGLNRIFPIFENVEAALSSAS